jgi:hypothetical protein
MQPGPSQSQKYFIQFRYDYEYILLWTSGYNTACTQKTDGDSAVKKTLSDLILPLHVYYFMLSLNNRLKENYVLFKYKTNSIQKLNKQRI